MDATATLRASASLGPPSLTRRAFAAARAALVRVAIIARDPLCCRPRRHRFMVSPICRFL